MTNERAAPAAGKVIKVLPFLLILTLLLGAGNASALESLSLWVHPYLPASELVKRFNPLAEYLSEKTGLPVSVMVQKSYQSHIAATGKDLADIAYLGPASYVKVIDRYGKKPLLARLEKNGKPVFYGMIIVRKDSPIRFLGDLVGKDFAFGDPNSTMSHLVPHFMLLEAEVEIEQLGKHDFLGSHHNVALAVLGGYFHAGGVKEAVFYEYEERGLRILATSPPIAEHVFATRSSLPTAIQTALRQAMMDLNTHEKGPAILSSIKKGVTGLAPVVDDDYNSIRRVLDRVGE